MTPEGARSSLRGPGEGSSDLVDAYLIAAPIGTQMGDLCMEASRLLPRLPVLFVESDGQLLARLRRAGLVGSHHRVEVMDHCREVAIGEELIEAGVDFGILSNQGLPAFMDPGFHLVRACLQHVPDRVRLTPIGMSSALDAALCLAGEYIRSFTFLGHYPGGYQLSALPADRSHHAFLAYVKGNAIEEFLRAIPEALPPMRRMMVFRNFRDRGGTDIHQWEEGAWKGAVRPWNQERSGFVFLGFAERLRDPQ